MVCHALQCAERANSPGLNVLHLQRVVHSRAILSACAGDRHAGCCRLHPQPTLSGMHRAAHGSCSWVQDGPAVHPISCSTTQASRSTLLIDPAQTSLSGEECPAAPKVIIQYITTFVALLIAAPGHVLVSMLQTQACPNSSSHLLCPPLSTPMPVTLCMGDSLVLRPASTSISVVLPAPELPTRAVKMPGRNAPLTSFSSCSIFLPPKSAARGPSFSGSVLTSCRHVGAAQFSLCQLAAGWLGPSKLWAALLQGALLQYT